MTLTLTSPQSMRFADAILERSSVVLLKGFAVNQMKFVPARSVNVTSDKTAARFCAFLWSLSFTQVKESDWPAGQKHGYGKRKTKNKAPLSDSPPGQKHRLNSPIH